MTAVITAPESTTVLPAKKAVAITDSEKDLRWYLFGMRDIGVYTQLAGIDAHGCGFTTGLPTEPLSPSLVLLWDDDWNQPRLRGFARLAFPVTVLVDEQCHGNQTCLALHHTPTCESLDTPSSPALPDTTAADGFVRPDPKDYLDL